MHLLAGKNIRRKNHESDLSWEGNQLGISQQWIHLQHISSGPSPTPAHCLQIQATGISHAHPPGTNSHGRSWASKNSPLEIITQFTIQLIYPGLRVQGPDLLLV